MNRKWNPKHKKCNIKLMHTITVIINIKNEINHTSNYYKRYPEININKKDVGSQDNSAMNE